jgi:excisionase family DNA binding protein
MSANARNESQTEAWGARARGANGRSSHRSKAVPSSMPGGDVAAGAAGRKAPPLPTQRPSKPVEYQELWDVDDVASYLGVPKQTIYAWRHNGYGPQGFRVGKHLRFRAATVVAWTLGLEHGQ